MGRSTALFEPSLLLSDMNRTGRTNTRTDMYFGHVIRKKQVFIHMLSFLAYQQHKQQCFKDISLRYLSLWVRRGEGKFSVLPDAPELSLYCHLLQVPPGAEWPSWSQVTPALILMPHFTVWGKKNPTQTKQSIFFMVSLPDILWAHLLYGLGCEVTVRRPACSYLPNERSVTSFARWALRVPL